MKFLLALLLLAANQPVRELTVTVVPDEPVQGQLVVVEVAGGRPGDRVRGTFGQQRLRFFLDEKGRVRALAAVRLSQRPGQVPMVVSVVPPKADPVIQGMPVTVRAGQFGEQELSVDPQYVKPPKQKLARIRRESRAIRRLWRARPTPRAWKGSFVWPLKNEISSAFGLRRMFNGQLKSRHYGLDIDGQVGEPVVAIGAGTVVMVADRYYSGGTVVIDHGLRLFSLYFHLSEYAVREGDRVAKGQRIGRVGKSGRVTGPHLHLSTKIGNVSFDPLSLLAFEFDREAPSASQHTQGQGSTPLRREECQECQP